MTQDVVERLIKIADAARRPDGSESPLSEQVREGAAEITRLRELSRDGGQEPVARSAVIKIFQDVADTAIDYVLSGDPENSRNRESMEAAAVRIRDAVALPSLYASTEGAVVGWIRGVKGASTPWDPGEWNVDYVHGDCPPGDGWTPLYASPSPSPDRDAIIEMCAEAADHCCGAGSSYIAAYIRSLKSSHVTGEDR
jgi:hypothetical protein